ncbi:FAM172 family protein homolog CG10038 isoform X2 [Contarinia nasturtii]|uniref:FAM172 family protein homolog CG10038 isoform X2 n=1 Tax=Contarinia nasturtii TaxID=265458 RepID=UPI0012D40C29|nr:FAM172 family protein homolog CG10038 isoform X2 [Contarinia nasturtii]
MLAGKLSKFSSASKRVLSLYSHCLLRVISQRDSSTMAEFPTTLKGFGYAFNAAGELRQINPNDESITDKPFKFEVCNDARRNQAHYEALGEVITEHVYQMLVEEGTLHKIFLPSPESPTSSFVFGTKTDFKNTKKLLFLIHGSGVVRAGQWSRSLIINQSINHGTQLPYIKRAISLGYDVLVTNTNQNENLSPEEHIITVWEQLIAPVYDTIDSFALVAHSYGGVVTLRLAKNYPDAFLEKCFAIGFTDSVHYAGGLTNNLFKWFIENSRNYVTSMKPLGTALYSSSSDIPSFSAGHNKHEWTSWACMEELFPFLERKYKEFAASQDHTKKVKLSNATETESEDDKGEGNDLNSHDNDKKADGDDSGEKTEGEGKSKDEEESKKSEETDEAPDKPETEEASDKPEELEKHEVEKTEKREDL